MIMRLNRMSWLVILTAISLEKASLTKSCLHTFYLWNWSSVIPLSLYSCFFAVCTFPWPSCSSLSKWPCNIPICHCFKVVDSNNNTCFFFWNNNGCCISYGCTRASANPASDIQSACLWPNQWRCLPFFRHRRAEAIMVLTTQACLKSWPAFNLTGMLVVKSCNDCCC